MHFISSSETPISRRVKVRGTFLQQGSLLPAALKEKTEVLVITRDDYEMYVGALWEGVVRHGLAVSLHKIAVFLADVGSMGQQLFLPGSSNTWKVSRIRSCTSVFNA